MKENNAGISNHEIDYFLIASVLNHINKAKECP